MPDVISLPQQQVPVVASCDVLVVGGGAAGISAAIAAARQGADVVLVERYGYLGGLASGGLIVLLLTLDDGDGRQVVAGQCQELVERLAARGACFYPPAGEWGARDEGLIAGYRRWGLVWGSGPHRVRYSVAYDPEELKYVATTWVGEAGVRLMLHRWASDVVFELERPHGRPAGRLSHVVFTSKAGRQAVRAAQVIDASGDGDIFALAGEAYDSERVHPWLWFRMAGVRAPDERASEASSHGDRDAFAFRTLNPGQALLPWGAAERIARRIDATDPDDLTFAEVECRRMVMDEVDRLRAQAPGFEQAYLTDVALTLGITESRRLRGAHVLAREEVDHVFPDAIASTGHWTKYGAVYHIPYRSLLPLRASNLLAAGRCISVDHRVHHATKEIPACFATGEAAGIAAAQALRSGRAVQDIDVPALQSALRRAGAWLPDLTCGE
ncbi:MAG: FAD-dependent oxidoreductase [Dehalococcoidia bacterium]|nr:FAD-dependent oxidoreductase [Dehalococcoidia bacterium]